jgi:hypothetical protein
MASMMITGERLRSGFQTFFVARELSASPLVAELIRFDKKLNDLKLVTDTCIVFSADYGNRLLITGNNVDVSRMNHEDIVEVVDYDPLKQIALVIGKQEPSSLIPVHWIIHKARDDVHAVVVFMNKYLCERFADALPVTEHEAPVGSLELAKELLQTLRQGKCIVMKNLGLLMIGFNLREIEDQITKLFSGGRI